MEQKRITEEAIQAFRQYLIRDEKSAVTVEKYLRDIRAFQAFIGETPVEKELVIHYKTICWKKAMRCGLSIPCWPA